MSTGKIPLLLVGDAPYGTSGLSRILTDLLTRMEEDPDIRSAFDVRWCGHQAYDGLPETGVVCQYGPDNRVLFSPGWIFGDLRRWGVRAIQTAYRYYFGQRQGVVFTIWDPARCYEVTQTDLPIDLWGYFAVDGENCAGRLAGGPATQAVGRYQRVLAYTQYGQRLLQQTTRGVVEAIPHGIDPEVFNTTLTADERDWAESILRTALLPGLPGRPVLGCVATNQRRKDLSLFFRTGQVLRERGVDLKLWLHVDRLVGDAWSVPQLAEDTETPVEDLILTNTLSSRQLAVLYGCCAATLAVGRGEGFGYPIAESLACGTPVAHFDYAGGAEITPQRWQVPYRAMQPEGVYGLLRPVGDPEETAAVVMQMLNDNASAATGRSSAASVELVTRYAEHLHWPTLWPTWKDWIVRGAHQ